MKEGYEGREKKRKEGRKDELYEGRAMSSEGGRKEGRTT